VGPVVAVAVVREDRKRSGPMMTLQSNDLLGKVREAIRLLTDVVLDNAATPMEPAAASREEDPDPLLDATTVAKRLGVTPSHVYKLAKTGKLPGIRVGEHMWRFRSSVVSAFLHGGVASLLISCW
jgi:excisionase family DNA binding protein